MIWKKIKHIFIFYICIFWDLKLLMKILRIEQEIH